MSDNIVKCGRGFKIKVQDESENVSTDDDNASPLRIVYVPIDGLNRIEPQRHYASRPEDTGNAKVNTPSYESIDKLKELVEKRDKHINEQLEHGQTLKSQLAENYKLIAEHAMKMSESSAMANVQEMLAATSTSGLNSSELRQQPKMVPSKQFSTEVRLTRSMKSKTVSVYNRYKTQNDESSHED